MARVSRKKQQTETLSVDTLKIYNTAIYSRLSIEDNGCNSDSIENQIYMLEKYISNKPYLKLCASYCDNGMTGTNFDRPGFTALINEIRRGKINCIVVKDLSRFGRNYIEAGEYLEKIFPYLGVRFISVNDQFDSNDMDSSKALMVSIKSLLHDIYAKDISRKICTSFEIKKRNGEYLGKYAPYGYVKSEKNRHKLVINEETAPIICDIFKWRIEGIGVTAIARKLNDLGIPSQYKYLCQKGIRVSTKDLETYLWRGSSVFGILTNPNYIGCIVERKSDSAFYKGKPVRYIPNSEWNIISETHEAIIDDATFYAVRQMIESSQREVRCNAKKYGYRQRKENILSGLVLCGKCGSKMERDGGYYNNEGTLITHRFNCPKKYIKEGACFSKSITEDNLMQSVFELVKTQIKVLANIKEIIEDYAISSNYQTSKLAIQKEIDYIQSEIKKTKAKRCSLYEDYKANLLSEREYLSAKEKYERDYEISKVKLSEIQSTQTEFRAVDRPNIEWIAEILQLEKMQNLTRELCLKLIRSIEVYEKGLKVHFTYHAEYENALSFLNQCIKCGNDHE